MNNYSDKVKCIIKQGQIAKAKLGIMGPTGPAGPATISVGQTTTGNPGTNANVVNTGTNQNAVLSFTIPAGPTGPKGEQGIQGETGPQGPQGPQGPAGTSATSVFGRKYSTSQDAIALTANVSAQVPLAQTGPNSGITYGTANALTIPEAGNYKVDYYFVGASTVGTTVTVAVRENATPIASSQIMKTLVANNDTDFIGSTINNFKEGDNISLDIKAVASTSVSPAAGTNAYLNITKL